MKKVLSIFFFISLLLPLHAQRVIKYITFYPVPYGSHQNLSVEKELYINMGNDVKAKVGGAFSVAGKSDFDGLVRVNSFSANVVSTNGDIKSGNSILMPLSSGKAHFPSGANIARISSTVGSGRVSGAASASGNTNLNAKSLSGLGGCSGSGSWQALRLKGSEECKFYLTCGGSGGETGCKVPPFMGCSDEQCFDGSTCQNLPDTSCTCTNGICKKEYYCMDGRGWMGGGKVCTCKPGYTSEHESGPCYKEEISMDWSCRTAGSGECRNPVNNRHDSPCQSLGPNCPYEGATRSYYSCQTCMTCTCVKNIIRPVFPEEIY